jgi:hypothetical protein
MGRESREAWAKRVERWRDSGLTAKEFADEAGINARTLSYWKWRLGRDRRTDGERERGPAAGPRRRRAATTRPAPVAFVEVVAPASETPPGPSAPAAEPFEITWPSGVRVRVPARFDDAALERLVQAVR